MKSKSFFSVYKRKIITCIVGFIIINLNFVTIDVNAQCTIIPNATPGPVLTYTAAFGTNATGVAFNPNFNLYYACIAGNPGFSYGTFSTAGVNLYQTNTGFDFRGLWWNPNTNQVEGTGFSNFGLWTSNLNGSGYALNTGTLIYPGQNQPTVQSVGDLDYCANEMLFFNAGTVSRYSRPTGAFIASFPITGCPVPIASLNSNSLGYTGCPGQEIALEDYVNKGILFFNKTTGAYVGTSNLPAAAVTNPTFRFSWANGLAWLYDFPTSSWRSFNVLNGSGGSGAASSNILGNDTTICGGNSYTLNATTAGATYLWNTGATSATLAVNTTGSYNVAITTSCQVTYDTIQVTFSAPFSINLGNDTSICPNVNITLNAGAGYTTYLWNTNANTSSITTNTVGAYSVIVTNAAGCTAYDTINISLYPPLVISIGNDTAVCPITSIVLNPGAGFSSYQWQNLSTGQTYTATTVGNYFVTVTNNFGCVASDTIHITPAPPLPLHVANDTTVCTGTQVTFTAPNGYSAYLWNNGSTNLSYVAPGVGSYSIIVTNNLGCQGFDTVAVSNFVTVQPHIGNDTSVCPGESVTFTIAAPFTNYLWQNNSTANNFSATNVGSYFVHCLDLNGCITGDTAAILSFHPVPPSNAVADSVVCGNIILTMQAPAGFTYLWSDGSTNQTIDINTSGQYSVLLTNNFGCTSNSVFNIGLNCPAQLAMPNAFTPDGDGLNDLFLPRYSKIGSYHIYIYNRWGQLLYETDKLYQGWDGTYQGVKCQTGVYVGMAEYSTNDDQSDIKRVAKGNVTLLR